MIGLILALSAQSVPEATPALTALTIVTGSAGHCNPTISGSITVSWTATNFVSGTQDFKVYRDGILVNTTDTPTYGLIIAGLVEGNQQHPQDITFNYRVDIVRTSDSLVLATRSASVTKSYGNCTGPL